MHNYQKLRIWKESIEVATAVYAITSSFPPEERFTLAKQMRASAVSISSNIAEGSGRGSDKDMARFLRMSLGSLAELESQVELSRRLGLVPSEMLARLRLHDLRNQIRRLHDQLSE